MDVSMLLILPCVCSHISSMDTREEEGAGTLVRYRDDYDVYITIYLLHSIDDAKAQIPNPLPISIIIARIEPKVGTDRFKDT